MSIIPQDAFLFTGTIRENIDPLMHHRESEIWTALQRCHLQTIVRNSGGLDSTIALSVGQGQLLCLTRAVLHNAKVCRYRIGNCLEFQLGGGGCPYNHCSMFGAECVQKYIFSCYFQQLYKVKTITINNLRQIY